MQKKSTKNWGQADKDLLNKLINRQLIDITSTPHLKIEQVRLAHFCHRNTVNFYRNFRDFLAAWDQELKYSGAQRREGRGKMGCLFLLFFCLLACPLTRHLPPPQSAEGKAVEGSNLSWTNAATTIGPPCALQLLLEAVGTSSTK